jgi:uncharacterized membrane protein YfcA
MELAYILAGFGVGTLVGLTGVGGGSLMTPLLIFVFGIPALTAVGTDLLFAAVTKASGIISHQRHGNVRWPVVLLLLSGSIPAAVATLIYIEATNSRGANLDLAIQVGLGIALMLTSVALLWRSSLQRLGRQAKVWVPNWRGLRPPVTILAGVVLGILVPLSSIGAGALGAAMLLFLYPQVPMRTIVGTDLAHAVPLTLVAGLGHWHMGSVDTGLLGTLLMGSLPGIYFGSHMSTVVPERVMRPLLASMLMLIGVKFVLAG